MTEILGLLSFHIKLICIIMYNHSKYKLFVLACQLICASVSCSHWGVGRLRGYLWEIDLKTGMNKWFLGWWPHFHWRNRHVDLFPWGLLALGVKIGILLLSLQSFLDCTVFHWWAITQSSEFVQRTSLLDNLLIYFVLFLNFLKVFLDQADVFIHSFTF